MLPAIAGGNVPGVVLPPRMAGQHKCSGALEALTYIIASTALVYEQRQNQVRALTLNLFGLDRYASGAELPIRAKALHFTARLAWAVPGPAALTSHLARHLGYCA